MQGGRVPAATISVTLDQLYTAVGTFLQTVLGAVPVVQGQGNQVAAPAVATDTAMPTSGYVQMQAFNNRRTATNQDTWDPDAQTQASESDREVQMALDFYGPQSQDWAVLVTTLWRDGYGVAQLAPVCAPLYADEEFQIALVDGEEQYEERWHVDAYLQYNPVTTTVQQSATALSVTLINVDEKYPP